MRTIKYQAWIKDEKRMISPLVVKIFNDGDFVVREYDGKVDNTYYFEDGNVELMEYTGLKDVNGTEIYEGDILEIPGYFSDLCNKEIPNHLGYVKYVDKEARFNLIYINDPICWKKDATFLIYAFKQAEKNGGIKKVGTIYENPELLKED